MEGLGIDLKLLIAQIINFILLLFLLSKFLYRPIIKILAERKKRIEESLENAQKIQEELVKIEERKAEELKKAKEQGELVLAEFREMAKRLGKEAAAKAEANTQKIMAKTQEQLNLEREKMKKELKKEVAAWVVLATEKLIGRSWEKEEDEKLITEILERIENEKPNVN